MDAINSKLTFLYKVLDDNQANIRFVDTKAAVGIAILSAILAKSVAVIQASRPWFGRPVYLLTVEAMVMLSAVVAATLAFRVIFPTINPTKNVDLGGVPHPQFYVRDMEPRRWRRHFFSGPRFAKLKKTRADYVRELSEASEDDLLGTMAAEALKVSFIREIKTDRLIAFAYSLIFTATIFFGMLMVQKPTQHSTAASPNAGSSAQAAAAPQSSCCCSGSTNINVSQSVPHKP
jgi:hypothetical protein